MPAKHFDPGRSGNPFDNDDGTPFDGGEAQMERVQARRIIRERREAAEEALYAIPAWEPFPVDALPRFVCEYVRAAAAAIDCDPAFIAHPALAVLSAAIGNSYRVQIKRNWIEPCTGWFVLISPSGAGKTPGQDAALRPVHNLEREARDRHKSRLSEYEAELETYKGQKRGEKGEKPRRPTMTRSLSA